ncbi:acyl transferase domain-containing protein [Nocardiopsis sp. Huas11]|uniref:type I polyketide synthase n=1 Tax=Nocardiopsis sp. Huas11 TaxID=2183912 RepID=UPI000EAFE384|nr:type I polyketide synthase [Nocardiopsis sp. Huas11]RKS09344.1 acyl transferase domain-containing protein [Nocardiopsis sp. Huas11]
MSSPLPDPATAIAVTGLACRFPGAPDAASFWDLLAGEREGLTRLTDAQLTDMGVRPAVLRDPAYVPVAGIIDGQDLFDPDPFGLTDAEAALLDPQQRLFLECAWRALEEAGHGGGTGAGSVGVFAGAAQSAYLAANLADRWDSAGAGDDPVGTLQTAIATQTDYLPAQTAYRLDLTGPAVAVNTACSTSLVAVHTAAQSLLNGECDTALAGGVSLIVPQGRGYLYTPDGIYSRDGTVRPFSSEGSGVVYTQGAGVVVLRRLADAQRDGDPVLAVLHGSAVNNDGAAKAGFTAPSMRGQARVLVEALAVAGADPRQIGYVEAHGTGTRLGDPIETAALKRVYGESGPSWCGLGSVKSNIGHTNSAAGIASFIKTVLALHHRTLPASLHAEPVNELLGLERSPFEVVTRTRPWEGPELAGVSSFGIGGTNAHAIVGPAPERAPAAPDPRPQLLPVAAHTRAALTATAADLAHGAEALGSGPRSAEGTGATETTAASAATGATAAVDPADLAYALQTGRAHPTAYRMAAVAAEGRVAEALRAAVPVHASGASARVVFAFPGGGSQHAGMGAELYDHEPVFARCVDECAELFLPLLGADIRDVVIGPGGTADRARDAAVGLPALFAVSLATARLLESWGVRPDAVLGHSLGEYPAAVVCGALGLADAVRLVAVRSTAVAKSAGEGTMLSVPLGEEDTAALLTRHPDVDLAVVNAPDACVVSGPRAAVAAVDAELSAQGHTCTTVHVDVAAHSRLVEPAMDHVRDAARGLSVAAPAVPIVSTVTGETVSHALGTADHWVDQLRGTVRFDRALRTAVGDRPTVLVQVGPGAALASLARRNGLPELTGALTTLATESGESDGVAVRAALGALWAHGAEVDFAALHTGARHRVAAPGYAFQRRRLWVDPPERTHAALGEVPDADDPLQVPVWSQTPPLDPAPLAGRRLLVGTATTEGSDAAQGTGESSDAAALRSALIEAGATVVGLGEQEEGPFDGAVVLLDTDPDRRHDPDAVTEQVLAHAGTARALTALDPPLPVVLQVGRSIERVESADPAHPAGATARVLPRVLAQETPGLAWRTLDLGARVRIGPAVIAELADLLRTGTGGTEAAVRGATRWVRGVVPWRPSEIHASPSPTEAPDRPFDRRPVALITGGLGDVGLTTAAHLSARGMRVVVTSRAAVAPSPEPGSRDEDRARALRTLAERGTPVEVRAVDAADTRAMTSLLTELADPGGPGLDLVVHAAGVVATADLAPLRSVTAEHVTGHVHSKVRGALALRAAVAALEPDRRPSTVVLMSSAGTLVGGVGMGPYCASNAFLDTLATEAEADDDHTRWISVVWDAWRVGPLGADRVVNLGFALDAATGMGALDRLLAARDTGTAPPVVAVSTTDLRTRMAEASRPVQIPGAGTESDGPADELDPVERILADLWSDLFGVPVRSADADFFALGGHSLLATRMLMALRRRFGVELGLRDVLAEPTLGAIAALVGGRAAGPEPERAHAPLPAPAHAPHGSAIPMTRVQHAYWVGRDGGYELGDLACRFYLEYDCADLDVARYEAAWNRVIGRHAMLRAVATAQGTFTVLDRLPRYRVRVHDLSTRPPERREARLSRLRERVARESGPADQWPLFQVQAVRLPEGRTRLLIGVDVLICDAASYWIIDREIQYFYENPEGDLPEPGVDFATCVAAIDAGRGSAEWERAARYWRDRGALPGAPELPVTRAAGGQRFERRTARLDPADWNALRERAARHGVTPTAVLLTAYAETLAAWSGRDRFALTLTLFDRPDVHPDVNDVVGDFTSLLLHEVDLADAPFADRVRAVHRRLFQDLDHRAFSALDLLSEQAARTGRIASVPVVFTSAVGLEDALSFDHDLQWAGTQVHALSQTPQTVLDHQVLVQRGALLLQWDALEPALPAGEVDRAFADHVDRVRRLATQDWTAEDHGSDAAGDEPAVTVTAEVADTYAQDEDSDHPPVCEDALLPLRTGTGDRTLFLLHPSGGDVLCYTALARALDPRVGVEAITDPGLVGGTGPDTMAGLARHHLALVRRRQPHGPYLLGGWSMGGDLAQEMACLLHEQGETVDLLVLLDSNDPTHITNVDLHDPQDAEGETLARHLAALEGYLGIDLGIGDGAERAAFIAAEPGERWALAEDRLREHGLLGGGGEVLRERVGVFDRHMRALAAFEPRRLAAERTASLVVRADLTAPRNSGIGMGVDDTPPGLADLGWGRHLAAPPSVAGLRADHYSLMRPPAVARLADLVNEALLPHIDPGHDGSRCIPRDTRGHL